MKFNKNPNLLPVFHNFAKSAGTYVLGWTFFLCRRYYSAFGYDVDSCKIFSITLSNGKSLSAFCHINKNLNLLDDQITIIDDFTLKANQETFLNLVSAKQLNLFSVAIDPSSPGWGHAKNYLLEIKQILDLDHLLNFMVIRNPYDRAQSLFNYLKSDNSSHEPTHKCYTADDFLDFICGHEIEDSWIIRNLIDLENTEPILPHHFTACDDAYLKYFKIKDIANVDDLINEVFFHIYGINQNSNNKEQILNTINENKSSSFPKIKFNDLPVKTQQTFLDRTYWDRKLWEKYKD